MMQRKVRLATLVSTLQLLPPWSQSTTALLGSAGEDYISDTESFHSETQKPSLWVSAFCLAHDQPALLNTWPLHHSAISAAWPLRGCASLRQDVLSSAIMPRRAAAVSPKFDPHRSYQQGQQVCLGRLLAALMHCLLRGPLSAVCTGAAASAAAACVLQATSSSEGAHDKAPTVGCLPMFGHSTQAQPSSPEDELSQPADATAGRRMKPDFGASSRVSCALSQLHLVSSMVWACMLSCMQGQSFHALIWTACRPWRAIACSWAWAWTRAQCLPAGWPPGRLVHLASLFHQAHGQDV